MRRGWSFLRVTSLVIMPVLLGATAFAGGASSRRAWAVGSPEQLNASLILTWDGTAWH
jgi:hypothetical protein